MKEIQAPRWIIRILERICEPSRQEAILGDLQELFEERIESSGIWKARVAYIFDAIGFMRPFAWKKINFHFTNPTVMLRNYWKLAIRNFAKQRVSSGINVMGFTIGIVSCLLIGLYIREELSFDQFHDQQDRLCRMVMDLQQDNGEFSHTAFTPAPWAPVMTEEFPEIEAYTRFMRYRLPVQVIEKSTQVQFYERDFIWADSALFSMFSFPLILGDPNTVLTQPHTVAISESAAKKYFGDKNPIGEVISYEGREELMITGVFKDIPENSHIKADFFASFSSLNHFWDIIDNWRIHYYYSYFLLKPETNLADLEAKMPAFIAQHLGEEGTQRFHPQWQMIGDIHLYSQRENELEAGGNSRLLYLFGGIGLLILLIAGANYVNLSTAGAIKRGKEIGIRKVLGSRYQQLVGQFLGESIFQILIASVLGIMLTLLLLPRFNAFTGKNIELLNVANIYTLLPVVLGIALLFGLIAGLYPAFYLARLKPIRTLKKSENSSSLKLRFRQILVIFQFSTCAALMALALIVNAQLKYMTDKDAGFSKEETLLFRLNGEYLNDAENIRTFKKQLFAQTGVKNATIASHRIVGDQPYYGSYEFSGIPGIDEAQGMGRLHVDADFVETFEIELLAGRAFDENRVADTSAFMINETALQRLGLQNPEDALGKLVTYETRGANGPYLKQGPIIGVLEDFHFRSLHFEVEPMVMDIQPARYHFLAVKLEGSQVENHIAHLEQEWQRIFPEGLFEYSFLDEVWAQQYGLEQKIRTLFNLFSFVGILIACLGLFGLATFITSQRTKEIGVRKILGASPIQILRLLSKDIFRLVFIALLIGLPLAYYFAGQWLADFSYRIPIQLQFFLGAGMMALLIALFTVSTQALKTILDNPVKALRED